MEKNNAAVLSTSERWYVLRPALKTQLLQAIIQAQMEVDGHIGSDREVVLSVLCELAAMVITAKPGKTEGKLWIANKMITSKIEYFEKYPEENYWENTI